MYCIVMPSVFVNCPAVICFPNIASYLRETPLVICGPWSYFYILFTTPAAIICLLLLAVIPTFFHTLLLTLCSARPERLTTSLFRAGQSSGLFLCRFYVVEGTTVNNTFLVLGRSHQQQPSDRSSSPTGPIKPWVDYSRKLAVVYIITFLLGFTNS